MVLAISLRSGGLSLYYEVHGKGEPLVVIPGGLMTAAMMRPIVEALAGSRQVIAVEPQGHGHTNDRDGPLSFDDMADDMASFINQLGLGQADLLGYSLGGDVALLTAIRHPKAVRRLVLLSARFRGDAEFPEVRAFERNFDPDMPALGQLREAYLAVKPDPAGWASRVAKLRELLAEEFDWSKNLMEMRSRTLIVIGDADLMPPTHGVDLFSHLGGGTAKSTMGKLSNAQLAVLPGTTHFDLLNRTDLLVPIITRFLDGP